MKLAEWSFLARSALAELDNARLETDMMLEAALSIERIDLRTSPDRELSSGELDALNDMLARRLKREPLQYILKRQGFMGSDFYVDERVLIPRPDTETLVEAALAFMRDIEAPRVLDVCAGSGCIGLSIKKLRRDADVTLADISRDAIDVIALNAAILGVSVEVIACDMLSGISGEFDLITCNPPYIRRDELASLQPEIAYEPVSALDGGADGYAFYRRLAEEAPARLAKGGYLLLEVGAGQARHVRNLFAHYGGIINDINGVERVVWLRSV